MKGSTMRTTLTVEAVLVQTGTDSLGMDVWEVQLMVNHHVVYRWEIGERDAWALKNNGNLESFVAAKIFGMLHPVTVRVRDLTP